MLQKKSGLPTDPSELRPLVVEEIERFSSHLSRRFGPEAGLLRPERQLLETYLVWKVLHDDDTTVRTEDQV